jgi:polygalacturonase
MIRRTLFLFTCMLLWLQVPCHGEWLASAASPSAVQQRGTALRDSILAHVTGARISTVDFNVLRFGAKNDGQHDCLPAFRKAIRKAAAQRGGARVIVPAGIYYLCGPLVLESQVCIDLQRGATLKFSPDPKHYPVVSTSWEGTFLYNYSPFIYGYGLHDVAITGEGTIDGNAMSTFATWKPQQKPAQMLSRQMNHDQTPVAQRVFGEGNWLRPHLIQFYNSRNITLQGVKIINSPFWCVHLLKSRNIICRALRYDAKLVNNDGIDPEMSSEILIEDIDFDNGDDNIAIKSGRDNDGWMAAMPSENIVIRNCRFKGLHAVVIGSEMSAGVRNVIVENCTYGGYCKRGIFIKTNPDRGGFVSDVYVRNCAFGDVEDLFYVTSRYAGEGQNSTHYSSVERLFVDSVTCREARAAALVLQGTEAKPVSHVQFNRVVVGKATTGVSFEHVRDVVMGDCAIGTPAGTPTQVTPADKIFERDK